MTEIYGYIYKIVNTINNKVYIGQTIQRPSKRKSGHLDELRRNKHHSGHLQNSFNKYGEDNFKFIVLNYATDKKTLDNLEIIYMDKYMSLNSDYGYNIKNGGSNGKHSLKTRKKIGKANSGTNSPNYGKPLSQAARENLSIKLKNRVFTKEHRKNLSESLLGEKHPFYGKHLSPTHRKKISNALKGKPLSESNKKGIRKAQQGKGIFGFTGANYLKHLDPEKHPWQSKITYNSHQKHLGIFEDPLTAEMIYKFVFNELI